MHQWLVEMLRRFGLHFRIFDEVRLEDDIVQESGDPSSLRSVGMTESNNDGMTDTVSTDDDRSPRFARDDGVSEGARDDISNPFMGEQLVLCSLEFLAANAEHYEQCLAADWDLLVVDEAHHLEWAPGRASHEYQIVENLANMTRGVLLLTATPEQLGKESHFARLRLLDPDRFPSFEGFVEEEKSYEPIAQVVEDLLEGNALSEGDVGVLEALLGQDGDRLLRVARNDSNGGGNDGDGSDDSD